MNMNGTKSAAAAPMLITKMACTSVDETLRFVGVQEICLAERSCYGAMTHKLISNSEKRKWLGMILSTEVRKKMYI